MLRRLQVFTVLSAAAVCPLLLTGCKSTDPPDPPPAMLTEQERDQVRNLGISYGEEVLKGMKEGDYSLFVKHFAPRLRTQFQENAFHALRARIGTIVSSRYLTTFSTPLFETYAWKVTVEQKRKLTEKDQEEKVLRGDILLRVTIMKEKEEYQIVGCIFN